MKNAKNNYVYMYQIDQKPIYIGIGQDAGGKYERARNLDAHLHAKVKDNEDLSIVIVAENLPRRTARIIETVLIQQYERQYDLLNRQRNSSLPEVIQKLITKKGAEPRLTLSKEERRAQDKEFSRVLNGFHGELKKYGEDALLPFYKPMEAALAYCGYAPSRYKKRYTQRYIGELAFAQHAYNQDYAPEPWQLETREDIFDHVEHFLFPLTCEVDYSPLRIWELAVKKDVYDFATYMGTAFYVDSYAWAVSPKVHQFRQWLSGKDIKRPQVDSLIECSHDLEEFNILHSFLKYTVPDYRGKLVPRHLRVS